MHLLWGCGFFYKLFIVHKDNCKMSLLEAMFDANRVLKAEPGKVLIKSANAMTKRWGCDRIILTLLLPGNYL